MNTLTTYRNPTWWTHDNDSSWERVKAAFKRDWDQTKHDVGANEPETKQNVKDTVKQATGNQPIPPRGEQVYEKAEPAYRFGYGARSYYGKRYSSWSPELERELRKDWANIDEENDWEKNSPYIKSGWNYRE